MNVRPAPGIVFLVGTLLAAQTLGTMATMMLPAVAPKVGATYGISASLVGYQISLLAGSMLIALIFGSRLSDRWGACRVQQAGLGLVVAGSVVAILPHPAFVFASALPLGLGYGLLTPSASHLLARFTPLERRNLIFSLKQTGVPLGGIGAAAITPPVAVAAFAAATIPRADPMRTGWEACRFGWSAFVVPLLFVLSPTLLLIGPADAVTLAIVTAALGIWLASIGLAGYFMRPMSAGLRIAFGAAGILALIPSGAFPGAVVTDIIGAVAGAFLIARELWLMRARERAPA